MNIVKTDKYTLYNGDCLDIMSQLESNYVTLVLCDLPYGSTPLEWDSVINFNLL